MIQDSPQIHWTDSFRIGLFSLSLVLLFGSFIAFAQEPVIAVDINFSQRQESEVHEPIFNSWRLSSGTVTSKTIDGIEFRIVSEGFGTSWYKTTMQNPYFARLISDGLKAEEVTIEIKGLAAGTHSFVAYHNTFDNPETNVFAPIDIYVQGIKVEDDLEQSNRATANDLASTSYVEFTISEGETASIKYKVESDPIEVEGKTYQSTVHLNGFKLNSGDPKRQASQPVPAHTNEHANADNGTISLNWVPIETAVSSNVYFGTSESALLMATATSPEFFSNTTDTSVTVGASNKINYYWRVDQVFAEDTMKGEVWRFKPRQLAFAEAEGYGRYAQGGRGGKVVHVTNLKDSGPGSLREAIENDIGPRTIVFDVSGIIALESRLSLTDDYVTIAGQTSPGKGICIRKSPFGLSGADDCIVQNIRVRLGSGPTADGMGMSGCNHSIIDHCSISWTIDESFSSRNGLNITLQRTLISEALNAAGHQNYGEGAQHGYAATIGGSIGSFHHNLLAHNYGRNWSLGGGLDGSGYYAGELDIFNNVVYNWGARATDGGAHEVNFVNNYYKKGAGTTRNEILRAQLEGVGLGSQSYYYSGNIIENTNGTLDCDGTDDDCGRAVSVSGGQVVDWEVWVDEPFFPSEATIQDADEAYKSVLSDVGCVMPAFDEHDYRIITETLEGSYTYTGSKTGKPGFPDAHEDVGGYEDYPELIRPQNFDSDNDGLPDWWETLKGLNPNSAEGDFSDSNGDINGDEYTNLEEYLAWMGKPHYQIEADSFIVINMKDFTRGYTVNPVYSILNTENCTGEMAENGDDLKITAGTAGFGSITFNVTDGDGSSMDRVINVLNDTTIPENQIIIKEEEETDSSDVETPGDTIDISDSTDVLNLGQLRKPSIYPNPTDNKLMIFNPHGIANVWLTNMSGEKVMELNNSAISESLQLDTSSLSSGTYIVSLSGQNGTLKMKFVKK